MTRSNSEAVIELRGLTKDYQTGFFKTASVRALDNLDLTVYRGEIFGFLGPNGAGKTTTLKLLMNLIFPTAGSAHILGHPVEDTATRSKIGYLPENPYFYDYLSGRELLYYTAALFGIDKSQAKRRADELLEVVGLSSEQANRQLRKYSKGMLQRIGIAQALVNDPDVVFMDEPMSGLDPFGRREIRDLLLSLGERSKTVFFSSHILSDVETLCDRAAILNQGKLVGCGTIDELAGGRQSTLEVIATGIEQAAISALSETVPRVVSVTPTPRGVHIILGDETGLDSALSFIRSRGGKLVSVNPSRASLEDAFFNVERRQ